MRNKILILKYVDSAITIFREKGILELIERFLYFITKIFIDIFYIPILFLRIKNFYKIHDLKKLINFVFEENWKVLKPSQIREEILELLIILNKIKPKFIIEIGTCRGGTLFLFSQIASENASLISIDLPKGKFGGGYSIWKIPLYKSFSLLNQQIHLIRADSHDKTTLENVKIILNNDKADFLFIDGDHTYKGVKKDFEMYSPLIKENGMILFHDIVPHSKESGCEVSKLWNEIKSKYNYLEIVKDWNQGWAGLGLIKK